VKTDTNPDTPDPNQPTTRGPDHNRPVKRGFFFENWH